MQQQSWGLPVSRLLVARCVQCVRMPAHARSSGRQPISAVQFCMLCYRSHPASVQQDKV